jgi:SEC-C motif
VRALPTRLLRSLSGSLAGFSSETHVKRGLRVVHGDKELLEKLGRNDPCPCGSGRSFQELLPKDRPISMEVSATTFSR